MLDARKRLPTATRGCAPQGLSTRSRARSLQGSLDGVAQGSLDMALRRDTLDWDRMVATRVLYKTCKPRESTRATCSGVLSIRNWQTTSPKRDYG